MEGQRGKKKNMFPYFKPKASISTRDDHSPTNDEISNHYEQHPIKYQRVDSDVSGYVQLDPAKRTPIWQCPINERDATRRAYILRGPYQPVMEYLRTKLGEQCRGFQKFWFEKFPWLACWKRVNDGKICALLMHTGSPTSPHNNAMESMSALMNVNGHINKVMNGHTLGSEENPFEASPKRHTELQSAQAIEIETMVATGIHETGTGHNQIGTLQRAGKMRWSSHFESIYNMIDMYSSVIIVLENMMEEASSNPIREEATALQEKSLEILNAMDFITFCSQNFQVEELISRFNDGPVELLRLSSASKPRDNFKLFNPETEKARHCHLIDRLIRLVLTFPVSTASTERSFLSMKLLKTSLRNKMEEELLANSMIVYNEREFTARINIDSMIDELYSMKNRMAHLQ
ncbi:uncharacterized protein [Primulina eburnea]|uniref:uncharacterized protein n=1 Tax=Primulina eburnea TaxID=1245227 RepID=UPI003C6C2E57